MPGKNMVNPSNIWSPIRSSKFATLYLIFIVVYSLVQIGLRAHVYNNDRQSYDFLETILVARRATASGSIPILTEEMSIELCGGIPLSGAACNPVWSPTKIPNLGPEEDSTVVAEQVCNRALNYPLSVLRRDTVEDAVSIALQVFALGLGILAVAQTHVSHFITGIMLSLLATIWAGVRVMDTASGATDFKNAILAGACAGDDLPNAWSERYGLDIAVLAVDALGFLLSLVFSYKAAQALGFNMTGTTVSANTNRIYKVMVAALVSIELSLFFAVTAGALWIQQIFSLSDVEDLGLGTRALFSIAEVIMIPVFFLGWVSIHREMWKSVLTFLACSFIYLAGWGLTFLNEAFRWNVVSWTLFGVVAVLSTFLACMTFICTLVSACFFGKGMKQISDPSSSSSSNTHVIDAFPGQHRRGYSESSLEKGDYSIKELYDEKIAAPVPTLGYNSGAATQTARIPKHKATAMARGLTVTPPPL